MEQNREERVAAYAELHERHSALDVLDLGQQLKLCSDGTNREARTQLQSCPTGLQSHPALGVAYTELQMSQCVSVLDLGMTAQILGLQNRVCIAQLHPSSFHVTRSCFGASCAGAPV
jgi:hypothetical protein